MCHVKIALAWLMPKRHTTNVIYIWLWIDEYGMARTLVLTMTNVPEICFFFIAFVSLAELYLCQSLFYVRPALFVCVCVRREWQISSKFNHIFFIHATMIMSFWNENCIYTESQCDDAHWSHTLYVAFNFPAVPLAAADPVSNAKYRRKTQISVW